jgi:hypothetical protein
MSYKTLNTNLAAMLLIAVLATSAGAADGDPIFNGKDLSGWKLRSRDEKMKDSWQVFSAVHFDKAQPNLLTGITSDSKDAGVLLRPKVSHRGSDIYSEQEFGDIELTLDFMVPKGSNSGVYLMGRYEVQVLDSFGKPDNRLGQGDVGAIYSAAKPSTNAARPPGEWQTFHIVFQAPRFDASGKKTANAKFLSVKLNGREIQKDVEVKGPTGGHLYNDEKPKGPLMFQGDHGIVAFRNVRIKPL